MARLAALGCGPGGATPGLAARREILTQILHIDKHFDLEDMTDWQSQWLAFAQGLPGVPDAPSAGDEDHIL
ncbi:MAG: hypothetical protein IT442_17055 [Phycisphaeraceae bacterium]|nr:hypothetical protein [Phycisphaeraceae bacterium]